MGDQRSSTDVSKIHGVHKLPLMLIPENLSMGCVPQTLWLFTYMDLPMIFTMHSVVQPN